MRVTTDDHARAFDQDPATGEERFEAAFVDGQISGEPSYVKVGSSRHGQLFTAHGEAAPK